MSELPEGWTITEFGNICDKGQYGWTTKASSQGYVKYLRTTDITKGQINWNSVPYCQEAPSEMDKYQIKPNDILISRAGSVGFSSLINEIPFPTVFASYLIRFIPSVEVEPRYVSYFLKSPKYWQQISEASAGIALANVNAKKLAELSTPLAPLNEQKRIADKLDRILTRVDACRENCDRIPLIVKRFRQSVLAAATSGELTEDWREETNRSKDSWQTKFGKEVFPFVTSGSRGWAAYYAQEGAIFLRVGNLNHDTIELDLRELQYVNPPTGAEGKRTRIEVGDILISITADIGMVALISADIGEAYINQHLCLARQSGEYCGSYLAHYLASPSGGLAQLIEMQRGMTKAGLTLGDIRSLKIVIPDLYEQQEIVRRVETLFAYADRLEAQYQKARAHIDRLTPAILDKAFRGELVPQDPNDEPASVLLERIQALRASTEKNQKPQRRKIDSAKPHPIEVTMLTRTEIQPSHLSDILKSNGSLTAEALWTASQLAIDDFYDQLKDEESQGLLRETKDSDTQRLLEAA
jgi:type I restriction enzyme, S subunit